MKIITDLTKLTIEKNFTLDEILIKMNDGKEAVLLVVENSKLLGIITDGDIRREMVTNGSNSNSNASKIMNGKPITSDDDYTVWKEIFLNNDIEHLPILDKDKNVIKIVRNVENQNKLSFNDSFALIIAGGLGTRMGENYKNQPKCLIEIKGKTILERTLDSISNLGLNKIVLSLNHEYQQIIDYVQNTKYKDSVEFTIEDSPLGTAGSLVSISKDYSEQNCLVLNSDILFDINFFKLKDFFDNSENDFVICTSQYEIEIPYGVIEKEELLDKEYEIIEKPRINFDVIAGIYFVKSKTLAKIDNAKIEMDELIIKIKELDKKISYFNIGANWIDVGNNKQISIAEKLTFIK